MKAVAASPISAPSKANSRSAVSDAGCADDSRSAGTAKAGCRPKKMRPTKVAVPVASATGRKVRALSSGINSSMANITPPIGVLKVAAMPAPAPAATSVMRCQGAILTIWPNDRTERGADLDDRAFAADRGAGADRDGGGERLHRRDDRADHAFLVVDGVHHFRHAMSARFRREIRDQESDDHAAQHGHQDHQRAPGARWRELVGVVAHRKHAEEGDVVDQPDQRAEKDRADTRDHTDDDGEERQAEKPEPGRKFESHSQFASQMGGWAIRDRISHTRDPPPAAKSSRAACHRIVVPGHPLAAMVSVEKTEIPQAARARPPQREDVVSSVFSHLAPAMALLALSIRPGSGASARIAIRPVTVGDSTISRSAAVTSSSSGI